MSISSETRKAGPYIGNGSSTVFPFAFKVFQESDVRVVLTDLLGVESDLVLNSDYTVSLNASQDINPGGDVTLSSALDDDLLLTLTSKVQNLQPVNLTNAGGFFPSVLNGAFDRAVILIQQLNEGLSRSLKVPISSTASPTLPAPEANSVLAWNEDADGFVNVPASDLAAVGAFGDSRVETFDGDGTETEFELDFHPGTLANMDISIDGVVQVAGIDFSRVGQTIVFAEAPPNGTVIAVRYTRPLVPGPNLDAVLSAVDDAQAAQAGAETAATDAAAQVTLAQLAVTDAEVARDAAIAAAASVNGAQAQSQAMWKKIRAEAVDVYVLFTGDSTGNETTEHYYLTAQWLATQCPTHSVVYRVANSGGTAWESTVTLQTGTGSKTIYVDNWSVAGSRLDNLEAKASVIFAAGRSYDLVVLNYGHNHGTDSTEAQVLPEFRMDVAVILQRFPQAGVFVTLQPSRKSWPGNPDVGGPEQTKRMVSAWRRVAQEMGLGVIDVYTPFANNANYNVPPGTTGSLYLDTVHPSPAGSAIWTAQDQLALAEAPQLLAAGGQSISPLSVVRPNLFTNPTFASWSSTVPSGITLNNCTAARNPGLGEGSLYSMELTVGSGANPSFTINLADRVVSLRGKTITAYMRVRKPSGIDVLAGRVALTATNGVTSTGNVSYPRSDAEGAYYYSPVSLTVPVDATTLVFTGYVGGATAGTDTGKKVNIAQLWIGEGVLPAAVDPLADAGKVLLDHYSDANVGKMNASGTLTVSNGVITLSGASPTANDVYINLYALEIGQQYRVRGTTTSATTSGSSAGPIYIRDQPNGAGSTVASTTWLVNVPTDYVFTATATTMSYRQAGYTGLTGMVMENFRIEPVKSGISPTVLVPLTSGRNADGTVLDATGGSGKFKIAYTPGTSLWLQTEDAQGNTKTDTATYELTIPSTYIAGRNLTVSINAQDVAGSGTLGTKTVDCEAYLMTSAGATGSDLCATAAQNTTTSAAAYAFTITGTTLTAGARLLIRVVKSVQETGGTNPSYGRINSVSVG